MQPSILVVFSFDPNPKRTIVTYQTHAFPLTKAISRKSSSTRPCLVAAKTAADCTAAVQFSGERTSLTHAQIRFDLGKSLAVVGRHRRRLQLCCCGCGGLRTGLLRRLLRG